MYYWCINKNNNKNKNKDNKHENPVSTRKSSENGKYEYGNEINSPSEMDSVACVHDTSVRSSKLDVKTSFTENAHGQMHGQNEGEGTYGYVHTVQDILLEDPRVALLLHGFSPNLWEVTHCTVLTALTVHRTVQFIHIVSLFLMLTFFSYIYSILHICIFITLFN